MRLGGIRKSMNWDAVKFDWNQVRAFLAAAEEGSFSAAARALKQTQPTLSRQIVALEETLGVTLFERGSRTLLLTDAGRTLLTHVRDMADAAGRIALGAESHSQQVGGVVTITATVMFATFRLPAIVAKVRQVAPNIVINLVPSNNIQDLTQREADISIRHARPEQKDLVGKLVGETSAHLFASKAFLDTHGRPTSHEEAAALPFVGFEAPERVVPALKAVGLDVREESFVAFTNDGNVMLALVREGLGATFLPREIEELCPDLEEVLPTLPSAPGPIWLTSHRELHTSRRIRIVFDILAEELSNLNLSGSPNRRPS